MRQFKKLFFALFGIWLFSGLAIADVKAVIHPYQPGAFRAGINVIFYRRDYTDLSDLNWKLDILLDRLANDHVNALSLAWLLYTDGVWANSLYYGKETPSNEAIALFIKKASERGFAVMLRPLIDEQSIVANGRFEWRGTIRPNNVSAWFLSYTTLLSSYAEIAQTKGAESLVIATELTSMEKYPKKWTEVIAEVRKKFKGSLTYSSNQGISSTMPWQELDFIGVDAFFKLDAPSNATQEQMESAWRKWVGPLKKRANELGKTLVFTEIGSTSQKGAHGRSWVWDHKSGLDLENQRRFYASACSVWKPRLNGMYWWATDIWIPEKPLEDQYFTPMGKPAEQEIAVCYK